MKFLFLIIFHILIISAVKKSATKKTKSKTWIVGESSVDCRFPNFATIQEAVDSPLVSNGDTVTVCKGEFAGASVSKQLHFRPTKWRPASPFKKFKKENVVEQVQPGTVTLLPTENTKTKTIDPKWRDSPWIISGPKSALYNLQDGFVFLNTSSGSSIAGFVFECQIPSLTSSQVLTRGIIGEQAQSVTVSSNLIISPRTGVSVMAGSNWLVEDNEIQNVVDNLRLGGFGIVLIGCAGIPSNMNQIRNNRITFPTQPPNAYPVGIFLSAPGPAPSTGPLQNNVIQGNNIRFFQQIGNYFGVLLYDNSVETTIWNDVVGNEISGSEFGIILWGARSNQIENNDISNILFVGIRLQQSIEQTASRNTIFKNKIAKTEFGIACISGGNTNLILDNDVDRSQSDCDLYDSGEYNIWTENHGHFCEANANLKSNKSNADYILPEPPIPT